VIFLDLLDVEQADQIVDGGWFAHCANVPGGAGREAIVVMDAAGENRPV
jgi:hypothetical protein